MNTMLEALEEKREWLLSPLDRCDRCGAEALTRISGLAGELLFCGHHYNKIMNDKDGYRKMMSFAITIVDEREKLIEDRAKGKDY